MRTPVKKILIFGTIILLAAGIYSYKEYHRRPIDVADVVTDITATANALVEQFENDEAKANEQYLGKAVEVNGAIAEISNQQDTLLNVFLGEAGSMHKVSCLLDKRYVAIIRNYQVGQQIKIRGICTGYLMDVELNRCVIIEDKKIEND